MSKILVTGGNGFVAAQVLIAALTKGYEVIATVRTQEKGDQTKTALAHHVGDKIANLSFAIVPQIEVDNAFDEVIKANQFVAVVHIATPFHFKVMDPKEMTGPAMGSTKSILKSIKDLGPTVRRVIITSSFASIFAPQSGMRPGYVYSEKDWNPISWEESHDGNPANAYYGAKTWAEKAAWDFIQDEKPQFELVAICPPMVFGEVAQYVGSTDQLNTSSQLLYAILTGKEKEVPQQLVMLWVNVKDVGTAHVLAIDAPNAGNKRFLVCADSPYTNKAISDAFIEHFPDHASQVPTKLPEGVDENGFPSEGYYTGDNSSSKKILGLTYQTLEDTMVQFANSVKNLPNQGEKPGAMRKMQQNWAKLTAIARWVHARLSAFSARSPRAG